MDIEKFFKELNEIMEKAFSVKKEEKKDDRPQPKFVGHFGIKYIIINEKKKKVSIHWQDGEITKAVCNEDDTFDPYTGFAVAFAKRKFVSGNAMKTFIDTFGFKVPNQEEKK